MSHPKGYGRYQRPRRITVMPLPVNFDSDQDYKEAMQIWLETMQGKRPRKDPDDYDEEVRRDA